MLFSFEPNFQGLHRRHPAAAPQRRARSAPPPRRGGRGQVSRGSEAAAGRLSALDRPLRVTVAASGAAATERLLRGYGARFETRRAAGQVHFSVANPRGLGIDEHPFAADLARRLRAANLPVRAFSMR